MTTATCTPLRCPTNPLRSAWLPARRRWQRLWMDERTAYLPQATSLDDLERRVRGWDDAGRRPRVPLLP